MSRPPALRGVGRHRQHISSLPRAPGVSTPCFAGRWSSLACSRFSWPCSFCLDPLLCGALVVTPPVSKGRTHMNRCLDPLLCGALVVTFAVYYGWKAVVCLDPLLCGALVVTATVSETKQVKTVSRPPALRGVGRHSSGTGEFCWTGTESRPPALRGVGRHKDTALETQKQVKVSTPCFAGRWSSPRTLVLRHDQLVGLDPLLCGALVVTRPPPSHRRRRSCLDPLLCGALVVTLTLGSVFAPSRRSRPPALRGVGRHWSS